MILEDITKVKARYKRILGEEKKSELSYDEMRDVVKFKAEVDELIQLLRDVLYALKESEEFGKTFKTAREKLNSELKSLEEIDEKL